MYLFYSLLVIDRCAERTIRVQHKLLRQIVFVTHNWNTGRRRRCVSEEYSPRQQKQQSLFKTIHIFTQCIEVRMVAVYRHASLSLHAKHAHALNSSHCSQKIIINDKKNRESKSYVQWHNTDAGLSSFPAVCAVRPQPNECEKWIRRKKLALFVCGERRGSTALEWKSAMESKWKIVGIWFRLNATASYVKYKHWQIISVAMRAAFGRSGLRSVGAVWF